ncbi:Translin-associated protein X [Pseudolycoriella hygida]|uniref:Translin-associated protein X n=1 Tax=Pseudolycoriella hygida TaxID=35572 RepID=A0A9Q0N4S7_9DIPT|nr:Translin-associated protein X [Pseudolycoriella hygida]
MSQRSANHRNKGRNRQDKEHTENIDETNPVMMIFKQCSKELDAKQDRYERIVKFSRDITIESKRIIFLLHTVNNKNAITEQILDEAHTRLTALTQTLFANIAKELRGFDQYQYARAFSSGLQEFVEAFTYYEYIRNGQIFGWVDLQPKLTYTEVEESKQNDDSEAIPEERDKAPIEINVNNQPFKCLVLVQPLEFMLGLGDLSGEIMRRCVTSLGTGDFEICSQACAFLQSLYTGYMSLHNIRHKDLSNKIHTLRQSVLKVENVCYNVTVRGGEAAKWGTLDNVVSDNVDEGFY